MKIGVWSQAVKVRWLSTFVSRVIFPAVNMRAITQQSLKLLSVNYCFSTSHLKSSSGISIMKCLAVWGLLCLQVALIKAFEIPFKLPFGLDLVFGKGNSPELFALHKDLINIPSVTGTEHEVGVFIANYLQSRNYTVERIPSTNFPSLN